MRAFDACLLDYGNTVVEFDRPQIDAIRTGLTEILNILVGPVEQARVSDCLEKVCAVPFSGDPPEYREITPHEQMEMLLGLLYDGKAKFPPRLVMKCDEALQDIFVRAVRVDAETVRVLASLKERIPVGLVSNYPCGKAIRRSLRKIGIDGFFQPLIVSGDLGYVKPHPYLFEVAVDALRVPPERVLFIGDRWDADMVGARNAGMRTCHHVGFTSDLDLDGRYEIYRPDYRIRHITELEGIIFGVNGAPRPAVDGVTVTR